MVEMETLKCVIIGDRSVGKSSMLLSCTTDTSLDEYMPNVIENFRVRVDVDGVPANMILWDTAGHENFERLRVLCYPQTDVFLLCFSLINRVSFENIFYKWKPEILSHSPNTPFLLIGNKKEMRDKTKGHGKNAPVTFNEGQSMSELIKAFAYLECSAVTKEGLKNIFHEVVRAHRAVEIKTYKRTCQIL